MSLHWLAPAASAFVCALLAAAWSAPAVGEETWAALRDGGVAVMRHARAPGTGDPSNFRLGDCATQRNLSVEGRAQSAAIGDRFRSENVEVGRVLHSRWCRARDTAVLAFPGKTAPEPALDSFFQDRSTRDARTAAIREIVEAWDGPGALVLVSHQVNVTALTGVYPREGEAVVLRGGPDGGEVVGRLRL